MLRASASPAATAAAWAVGPTRTRRIPGAARSSAAASSPAVWCSASSSSIKEVERKKGLGERLRMGRLEEDGLSYKENFIVRCYEVGINKTATVETIANLLQEIGCNHAQSVGFSTDGFATTTTMRKLHLIWVTARMHIEIYKYPAWGDVVEIETWCQGEGRIGTRRDWILKDLATGYVIGRATSKWVMMNQDTRKLQRVSDEVREEYLIFCPRAPRVCPKRSLTPTSYKQSPWSTGENASTMTWSILLLVCNLLVMMDSMGLPLGSKRIKVNANFFIS